MPEGVEGGAAEIDSAPVETGAESVEGAADVSVVAPESADSDAPKGEGAKAAEAQAKVEKAKYKFKDREYDEDEILSRFDKADKAESIEKGSYKKFEEAAQMRKEVGQLFQAFVADPKGTLRWMHQQGLIKQSPEDISAEMLDEYVKFEQMTPEQKRLHEYEKREAATKASEAERQRQSQFEKDTAAQREFEQKLDIDLQATFKEYGLPKTVSMMQRVGARLRVIAQAGQIPDTAAVRLAGAQAVQDLQVEVKALADTLPEETLRTLFPGLVQKLHKADVQRVLNGGKGAPPAPQPGKGKQPPKAPTKQEDKTFKSFREMRDSIFSQPVQED